jgi:hypothetical protein
VTFVLIGAFLFIVGAIVSADIGGLGTKWREVSMSFYDRSNTRYRSPPPQRLGPTSRLP